MNVKELVKKRAALPQSASPTVHPAHRFVFDEGRSIFSEGYME